MGDQKMSKSLGNVLSVDDVIDKGFSPMDLRYYLLSVHYRTQLKFSWKGMEDAAKERKKILEWIDAVYAVAEQQSVTLSSSKGDTARWIAESEKSDRIFLWQFASVMNEDLNVAAARAEIFGTMNFFYQHQQDVKKEDTLIFLRYIEVIRHTFGCFDPEEKNIPADVQSLVDERARARAAKNFAESDRLRDAIDALGYEVRDGKDGQVVKRK